MKNPELDLAFDFVQYTNKNIFLTGKAGTGKTTFLRSLKMRSHKRMVVVAPTGVAAINAGGVTMHSFFQLPFGPIITEKAAGHKVDSPNFKQKFNKQKINIIKSLDLLIIDEISMVRADMLDAVDMVLRRYKNRYKPFGGVQLLMIGDMQQLAPVVKEEEWNLLKKYYSSMYFFNSKAINEANMVTVELKHVYRQSDGVFLKILNQIRNDKLTAESFQLLHERYIPNFQPKNNEGYINLTTHNNSAERINNEHLEKIKKQSHFFKADVSGIFSEYSYPTALELELKVGSQVMFVKNDSSPEKRYFNGKIGRITDIDDDLIIVECDGDVESIDTGRETWKNIRYTINEETKEIEEGVIGSFTQYPLRLAWAITIHKSQGLTFEKAVIDAAAAFAHGQTYVALSRCKTLEGLVLSTKISENAIICDSEVNQFNLLVENNQPDEEKLNEAKFAYQLELIQELFGYKQLSYATGRAKRVVEDNHHSLQGNIYENLQAIQKTFLPEITKVSNSFLNQVIASLNENPDMENNGFLQERIRKASEYFYKYNEEKILALLKKSSFETDNRKVGKDVEGAVSPIHEMLAIKQKCLKLCCNEFKVKAYLDVRAKAAIEPDDKPKKQKVAYRDVETNHPDLYSLLKFWRREEAETNHVPHYQIASQKMLQGIANELPVTSKQLLKINGVGKVKLKQYGEELISMVLEYIEEKGLEKREDEPEVIKERKKKSHVRSFELYKAGKPIKEIADELGFVVATIENHLCRYVASGDLKVEEFVAPKLLEEISTYFKKHPDSNLGDAKMALPDKVTYSQIRFVLKHLAFLEMQNS